MPAQFRRPVRAGKTASAAAMWISCLFVISGCASMKSSKDELQNPGPGEGIVFGSVLINVAPGSGGESGLSFLQGQKSGDATYDAVIWESGFGPLKKSYLLTLTPGIEETFVKKLPAGNYEIKEIQKKGFSALTLYVGAVFKVVAGQATYIGRLTIRLPDRITLGSPVRKNVADAQAEASAQIESEYQLDLSAANKTLMVFN